MSRMEVSSEVTGKVWKLDASAGQKIDKGDVLIIVESMKMEIPVVSPQAGLLLELLVTEGETVEEGQIIAVIEYRS
ncbi:MAG: biotin/lipoyl-binding carrier protein [Pigmentiphaga sp.]